MVSHEFQQQRLIGYARVSTGDQELSLQIDSLLKHGVKRENIFCDKLSARKLIDRGFCFAKKVCDVEILSLFGGSIVWDDHCVISSL